MSTRIRQWLVKPVLVDLHHERPFRLRFGSASLLLLGWVLFLSACVLGTWATKSGLPVNYALDAATGSLIERGEVVLRLAPEQIGHFSFLQTLHRVGQFGGAVLFLLGLASVFHFDCRDLTPNWKPRSM